MSNNTDIRSITFWNFLKENTIEIPIIQRDYAQGRLGKENMRKNFLADLKNALDSDGMMRLDFVYGSIENDNLNPLDGQQRLTTLWLLHWYIALRAGELSEDNCKIFRKFTYETRISSREFCEILCKSENFKIFDSKDIVDFITKQTWFYSAWKQDPTIQSMLRMLGGTKIFDKKGEEIVDGIEEIFQGANEDGFKSYWEKLTQKETIVFYYLPLKDFGLSDDLYIKMNARGKQLTSFENFKADLIGYITKQSENETLEERAEWNKLLDAKSGIPIKMDTDWTDIFWKNKSIGITDKESKKRKSDQIDEIYFAFLNRFFWNELFIAKKSNNTEDYILDIGKGEESSTQGNNNTSYKYLNNSEHDNDTTIAYEGLDVYRFDSCGIPLSFFQKLKRVLDNYFKYSKGNCLPECPWEPSFRFIPIYEVKNDNNIEITNNAKEKLLRVSTLNQVQRVVFFAVCKYFDHDDNVSDSKESLKRWMRVVWNLVSGEDQNGRPEIRSTSALRAAIKFIDSLESHDVYKSLRDYEITLGNSSFEERCKEEIGKAKQILDENGNLRKYEGSCKKEEGSNYQTWEEIIIDAEKYAFFKGTIRFLFQNAEGKVTEDSWKLFDNKWANAKEYFNGDGVCQKYVEGCVLLRTLISYFSKWENFTAPFYVNSKENWLVCILLNKDLNAQVNRLLSNNIMCDFENFESDIDDARMRKTQDQLVKTTILDYLNGEWYYLEKNNVRLHIWHKNHSNDIYLGDNVHENKTLVSLIDENRIVCGQRIKNSVFFRGENIEFQYNNQYFFIYYSNNTICLMNDNWIGKKLKNSEGNDEPENHFYFSVDEKETKESFLHKLDCLIAQAYPDTDKSVCLECKEKICESTSEQ